MGFPVVPRTLLDYSIVFLPIWVSFGYSILIPRILGLKESRTIQFLFLSTALGTVFISPFMIIPSYGVLGLFYVYIVVLDRYMTLQWYYYLVEGQKFFMAWLGVLLLATWGVFSFLVSSTIVADLLGLNRRRAIVAEMLFVSMTSSTCILLAWCFVNAI